MPHSLCYQPVVNPQRFPIQHIAESFCTIPLNDSLPAIQPYEVKHVFGQLSNGFVQANFTPINNVDAVGLWITDLIPHEAAKAWKVGGDAGDTHDGTFGGGVSPRFVVAWKYSQVATPNEILVIQAKEWIGGIQKFGMKYNLQ